MRSGTEVTQILLERDYEDKELIKEIESIAHSHYSGLTIEFYSKYPKLRDLYQLLRAEIKRGLD